MNEYVLLNNNNKIILIVPELPFILKNTDHFNFDNIHYDKVNHTIFFDQNHNIEIEKDHQSLIISAIKNKLFDIAFITHENKPSVIYTDIDLKMV